MNKIYSVDLYGLDKVTSGFMLCVNRDGVKGRIYYGLTHSRCARIINFMLAFAARIEKRMSEQP